MLKGGACRRYLGRIAAAAGAHAAAHPHAPTCPMRPCAPRAALLVSPRCRQPPLVTAVKGVPIRDEDQLAMGALLLLLLCADLLLLLLLLLLLASCCCCAPLCGAFALAHPCLAAWTRGAAVARAGSCQENRERHTRQGLSHPPLFLLYPLLSPPVIDIEVRWAGEPDVVMQLSGIPGAAVAVRTCQVRGPGRLLTGWFGAGRMWGGCRPAVQPGPGSATNQACRARHSSACWRVAAPPRGGTQRRPTSGLPPPRWRACCGWCCRR